MDVPGGIVTASIIALFTIGSLAFKKRKGEKAECFVCRRMINNFEIWENTEEDPMPVCRKDSCRRTATFKGFLVRREKEEDSSQKTEK